MTLLLRNLLLASALATTPVFAADEATDADKDSFIITTATCADVYDLFEDASPSEGKDPEELAKAQDDVLYFVVWVHGFLNGRDGLDLEKRPLGKVGIEKIIKELDAMCEPDESKRFLDVVQKIQ